MHWICRYFRQLLALIVVQALSLPLHAATQCQALFQQANTQAGAFTFSESLSVEQNLVRFGQSYGLPLDLSQTFSFPLPSENFVNVFGGYSVSKPTRIKNGVKLSMEFGARNATKSGGPLVKAAPLFRTGFPDPEFLGEKWAHGDQSFRFFNVGSRLLLKGIELESFEEKLMQVGRKNPGKRVRLDFDPQWALARQMYNERQEWASAKAVSNYLNRKPYLAGEDLFSLRFHDHTSKDNNDFLILMKDTEKDPMTLTPEEFNDNLAAIVRVARLSSHQSWLTPSIVGGFSALQDVLPHYLRLSERLKPIFKSFFGQLQDYGNLRIAELSRLNRFTEFSPQIMDAFLLKMFESAMAPGGEIDLFVIECDKFTARLFSRIGFQKLAKISPNSQETPEFLMYLDTRTDRFQKVLDELRKNAGAVQRKAVSKAPPPQTWSFLWGAPNGFERYSGWRKKSDAQDVLSVVRAEIQKHDVPVSMDLIEKASIFAGDFARLFSYVDTAAGSRERILIIGEGSSLLSYLLKIHFPDRQITTFKNLAEAELNAQFDKVVTLNIFASIGDQAHQREALEKLSRCLTPNGRGLFVEFYLGKDRKTADDLVASLRKDLAQNEAPLTNDEIESVVASRRIFLHRSLSQPVAVEQFLASAGSAGFITDRYFGSSEDVLGGQVIMLWK